MVAAKLDGVVAVIFSPDLPPLTATERWRKAAIGAWVTGAIIGAFGLAHDHAPWVTSGACLLLVGIIAHARSAAAARQDLKDGA